MRFLSVFLMSVLLTPVQAKQLIIFIRSNQPALKTEAAASNVYRTGQSRGGNPVQKIVVQDGKSAYISQGQSFPMLGYSDAESGIPGVRYEQLSTGYVVTPHLLKDEVELKISGIKENFNMIDSTKIDTATLETTVTIPLGQWVNLSETVTADDENPEGNNVYSTQVTATPTIDLDVKVLVK